MSHPKRWNELTFVVSVVVAVGGAAFVVGTLYQRVANLEEELDQLKAASSSPVVFGEWQLKADGEEHKAETDGIVVVRSYGGNGSAEAERDFEILVQVEGGQFRPVSRGGAHQGAAVPVPKDSRWKVSRGDKSNAGLMSVHWLPLVAGDAARGRGAPGRE